MFITILLNKNIEKNIYKICFILYVYNRFLYVFYRTPLFGHPCSDIYFFIIYIYIYIYDESPGPVPTLQDPQIR